MKARNHTLAAAVAIALAMCSCASPGSDAALAPEWLETDSASAMHSRLLRDFPVAYDEGVAQLVEAYPGLMPDSVDAFVRRGYVEVMDIDGQTRMFRKSVRNLGLLAPQLNGGWSHRGCDASPARLAYADTVVRGSRGEDIAGTAHRVRMRFSIDVPYHPCLAGDTLSVWMPFPLESGRQGDVRLLATSQPDYVVSEPGQSVHRTVYMQAPVADSDTTHFDYEVEFVTRGLYVSPADIRRNLRPYDTADPLYRKYTAFDGPHYVRLDSLARAIVGDETDPYLQSEMVYDYIVNTYPWAGAREYSTIPSLPLYVVEQGHGDCGQVALLYISLMRTLGVPARWESGWMLHPGEKNYHDWAEVYYNGVGWVPVDVSFGRYTTSPDPAIANFYSTGIDAYRFAANDGVSGEFYPPKRYMRSETVDSQAGEVESTRGNLFYPGWDSHLEIISIIPEK